jgi:methyl-accepting chemotaxis protein
MNVVAKIRETLEQTAELIDVSARQFQELQAMGYRNLALGEMHDHVDEIRSSLREVLHGCNIREINELARSIKHVAKHTAYDFELVQALNRARERQTRIALAAAGLLLVLAAMFVGYRRAFCGRFNCAASTPDERRL